MENMRNKIEGVELTQRWEDETLERKESISLFVKNYFQGRGTEEQIAGKEIKGYDSFTELHFSGANINVNPKIKTGEAEINSIRVYYDGGEIKQIHIVYDSGGKGHNVDACLKNACLKNATLKDYLKESEGEIEEN